MLAARLSFPPRIRRSCGIPHLDLLTVVPPSILRPCTVWVYFWAGMITLVETRRDTGFNREARKAILELTGKVDGPAPLHDLLARLFPHRDCPPNNER